MSAPRKPRIGLALGSGSARGWAHVGVIRALEEAGIRPDLVCGTSIGAVVGAAYAAGELARFEKWVLGLGVREALSLMDVGLGSGLLKGERVVEFLRRSFVDRPIEDLPMPFAAVATSIDTGAEIWLREGSTIEAVRASMALPGLFAPVRRDGSLLVDGGLVNPVPVSLARAMGADIVIAVELSSDMLGRRLRPDAQSGAGDVGDWMGQLQQRLAALLSPPAEGEARMPSVLDVMIRSINVMQVRIMRSRMAGEPPDLTVAPRLAHLGLLDFHRGREAVEEGRHAVQRVAHNLPLPGTPS